MASTQSLSKISSPLSVRGNIIIDAQGKTSKHWAPHRVPLPLNFGSVEFVDFEQGKKIVRVTSPFARCFRIDIWLQGQDILNITSQGARDTTHQFSVFIKNDVIVLEGPNTSIEIPCHPEAVNRVIKETEQSMEKLNPQERLDACFLPCYYCDEKDTTWAQRQIHYTCKIGFGKHVPACEHCSVDMIGTSLSLM